MRKNNNIIKINGQSYDAKTGALLSTGEPSRAQPKTINVTDARPERLVQPAVARQAGKPSVPRAPKPSRTLMRHAVHKPEPGLKRHLKAQGHTDIDALAEPPLTAIKSSSSVQQMDARRLRRANQVAKSQLIRHFSPPDPNTPIQVPTELPARPTPPTSQTTKHHAQPAKPAKHPQTTADILARAIDQATSHEEPAPAKPTHHGHAKRVVAIGAAMGLPVLVLGLIVTQNLSSVRLQMASAKAGFNANLPDYHPAGFSLGPLNYSTGVVAAQYLSNGDNHRYTITQKQTDWNSTTLRDSFVAPTDPDYQAVQSGSGQTIYLYGKRDATWVNGGIWYVIQSDGSLSDQQLIKLASSL